MSQHRKHRGYESQRFVAEYLAAHGFPYADSAGAGRTGSDITGTPGLDFEVKARRGIVLTEVVRQLEARADTARLPVGVIRPDGWGWSRIGSWPVIVPLADAVILLRLAGYGEPLP